MRAHLAIAALVGCSSEGTFDLVLQLPSAEELRPNGMTTVTVVLTEGDKPPVATTSVLVDGRFSAGDLAAASDVRIEVLLRDVQNRVVGVGEVDRPVDIVAGERTQITIPVRRPFSYASDGAMLYSFDPTLDQTEMGYQGRIGGVASPQVVVSVGGDRLAIVGATQLTVIATDTNQPIGSPITLPGGTNDAAVVPGTSKVAVAHDGGLAIVDLDSSQVQNVAAGAVDRVTVGPNAEGKLIAHGLIGRVEPPMIPVTPCTGTSMLVSIDVDAPASETIPRALPQPTSDLAAAPDSPHLYATLPCANKVVDVQGIEAGTINFGDVAPLDRASVLTVDGNRVWAVGVKAATIDCSNGSGGTAACTASSSTRCPQRFTAGSIASSTKGASVVIQSIPIGGGAPVTLELPQRRESMIDLDDPARQHAEILRALGVVPRDLVVMPGGENVGIVMASQYYLEELVDQFDNIIIACLDAKTTDWMLVDVASSSIAQRVRTSCDLVHGPADPGGFANWACDEPPVGEEPKLGQFEPISIGGLFGAR